jgi:general secretion pathway protein I
MTRRTRARLPRRGMSLLEVLLALTILVLSIAGIARLVDIGSERAIDARALTRGARLAQNKMAEAEAGIVSLGSETTGNFDGEDANWEFTVTPEPTGPPNLFNVTVRVKCVFQGRPAEVVLTQLVFDPTKTGSTAQAERPAAESVEAAGGTTTGGTTP